MSILEIPGTLSLIPRASLIFSLHVSLPYFLIRLLLHLLLPPSLLTHPSLSIDITSHLTLPDTI